ncbi:hypothetical protein [Paenibacillus sp. NPDC058177]|uniref:hypothetical protein n=1 Tax=Paenibacillus sp. NPDC058177 TaxID=3346369 RepID=UPI0036D8C55B
MDSLILQLEELTNELIVRLDMTTYEELEQFIIERQTVIDCIEVSYNVSTVTEPQKERVRLLLKHDSSITHRMETLRNEAQEWLQQRNIAKVQRDMYNTAYTPDSFLMDRKK